MIEKLNLHYAFTSPASTHDEEALTALELAGRQGAKINEIAEDQNNLRKQTEEKMKEHDVTITNHINESENRVTARLNKLPSEIEECVGQHIENGSFDAQLNETYNNLDARINNLIKLEAGSTTGDAELTDLRLSADGVTGNTAGAIIREQFKERTKLPFKSNATMLKDGTKGFYGTAIIFLKLYNTSRDSKYYIKSFWKSHQTYGTRQISIREITADGVDRDFCMYTMNNNGVVPTEPEYFTVSVNGEKKMEAIIKWTLVNKNVYDYTINDTELSPYVMEVGSADGGSSDSEAIYLPFKREATLARPNGTIGLNRKTIRFLRLYGCTQGLVYYINAMWKNHASELSRTLQISSYDPATGTTKSVCKWVTKNGADGAPTELEYISSRNDKGQIIMEAVVDWTNVIGNIYDYNYLSTPLSNYVLNYGFTESSGTIILPSIIRVGGGVEHAIHWQNVVQYADTENGELIATSGGGFTNYGKFAKHSGETGGTLTVRNNTNVKTTTIGYVNNNAGNGKNIKCMFIGDSLTDADAFTGHLYTKAHSHGVNLELIGTLGSVTNKNEGRAGWRAYTYTQCSKGNEDLSQLYYDNPFWNPSTEKFDFAYYMDTNGFASVDAVFICLGTNDVARGNYMAEAQLLSYYDTMINSIRAFNSSIKICLWMPPCRALFSNTKKSSTDTALTFHTFLIKYYDGREAENIYLVPVYLNVDPERDYKYVEVLVSEYYTDKVKYCTDNVHLSDIGYKKIADVILTYVKYFAQ